MTGKETLEHTSCVICGKKSLKHFCYAEDDNYFKRNNLLHLKKTFELAKCDDCGMVFVRNPVNTFQHTKGDKLDLVNADTNIYYRHHYIFSIILWNIIKQRIVNPSVLEVGCGFGQLGRLIKKAGYNYAAIEPSIARAEFVKRLGIEVYNETFDEYISINSDRLFDVIIFDNVIEHIQFPSEVIKKTKFLLKDNGILILIAPNHVDIRRFFIPGWGKRQIMPVGHCNYFSSRTLRLLMEKNGFRITLPVFMPKGVSFVKGITIWIKLIFEKALRIYPLGLYMCGYKKK